MSTVSASAATIFDLVIGFAIDSILQWAGTGRRGRNAIKKGASFYMGSRARCQQDSRARPCAKPASGAGGMRSGGGGSGVAHEEQGLARAHEAELFASQPLDGAGVGAQGRDLGREVRVLRLQLLDLARERFRAV